MTYMIVLVQTKITIIITNVVPVVRYNFLTTLAFQEKVPGINGTNFHNVRIVGLFGRKQDRLLNITSRERIDDNRSEEKFNQALNRERSQIRDKHLINQEKAK